MSLVLTPQRTDTEQMKSDRRKNFPTASDVRIGRADIQPMLLV